MPVSRLTLPSAFANPVDAMILAQPQPQFLGAMLIFQGAAAAELMQDLGGSIGPNAQRQFTNQGAAPGMMVPDLGAMQLDLLDPEQRASVLLRGPAVTVKSFLGKAANEVVKIRRPVFEDTTYTESSRDTTRATISTASIGIQSEMVSITLKEFSGPYDQANSRVAPIGIENFDLRMQQTTDLVAETGLTLRRDRMKWVDTVVWAKMVAAPASTSYVYPGDPDQALSTDASAFLTQGDRRVDVECLQRAGKILKDLGAPTFANGRYMAVLSTRQTLQLKNSSTWKNAAKYFPEKNPLFTGYVGTVDNVDVFECATLPTTSTGGITVQRGVVFGPGFLGYAIAEGCHVATADDTDYGRRVKIIWQAIERMEILDARLGVVVRSD